MSNWYVIGGEKVESFAKVLEASKRAGELLQQERVERVIVMSKEEYLNSEHKRTKRGKKAE